MEAHNDYIIDIHAAEAAPAEGWKWSNIESLSYGWRREVVLPWCREPVL